MFVSVPPWGHHQQPSRSIFGRLVTKDLMIGTPVKVKQLWQPIEVCSQICSFDAATSFCMGNSPENPFQIGKIPGIIIEIIEHQPELRTWPLRSFKQEIEDRNPGDIRWCHCYMLGHMGNHMCKAHNFAPTLRNKEASNCEPCFQKTTYTFHSLGRPFPRRTVWMGSYSCTSNEPEDICAANHWELAQTCALFDPPLIWAILSPLNYEQSKVFGHRGVLTFFKRMKYQGSFSAEWDSLRLQTNQPNVTNLETWQRNSAAHDFTGKCLILVILDSEMLGTLCWCSHSTQTLKSHSQQSCWDASGTAGAGEPIWEPQMLNATVDVEDIRNWGANAHVCQSGSARPSVVRLEVSKSSMSDFSFKKKTCFSVEEYDTTWNPPLDLMIFWSSSLLQKQPAKPQWEHPAQEWSGSLVFLRPPEIYLKISTLKTLCWNIYLWNELVLGRPMLHLQNMAWGCKSAFLCILHQISAVL